jgi:hypothetical protein
VLVWLGEQDNNTDIAFGAVEKLDRILKVCSGLGTSWSSPSYSEGLEQISPRYERVGNYRERTLDLDDEERNGVFISKGASYDGVVLPVLNN